MTDRAPLTHAGAVVWRQGPDVPLFLLVTASGRHDEWVLPKGHIEKGESPAETAYREVLEETGLEVSVGGCLGTETFAAKGSEVVCAYFLSRYTGGGLPVRGGGATVDRSATMDGDAVPDNVAAPDSIPAGAELVAEGRLAVWLPRAEAIEKATFPACRRMLEIAGDGIGLRR